MKKHKFIIIAILAMTASLAFTCACGVGNGVKDNQISDETSSPSDIENGDGNENGTDSGESSDSENGSDCGESTDSENGSDSGESTDSENGSDSGDDSSGGDIELPFVPFCN